MVSHLRQRNRSHVNVKVVDVGLLQDDRARHLWPLVRVSEVYPSGDGIIWTIKTLARGRYLVRPVQKWCPLELC